MHWPTGLGKSSLRSKTRASRILNAPWPRRVWRPCIIAFYIRFGRSRRRRSRSLKSISRRSRRGINRSIRIFVRIGRRRIPRCLYGSMKILRDGRRLMTYDLDDTSTDAATRLFEYLTVTKQRYYRSLFSLICIQKAATGERNRTPVK